MHDDVIHIIGGGLAGSEAAWQAANLGVSVIVHEMRPVRLTDAHTGDKLAELVCSNSFRSDDAQNNAVGLLHAEMRLADSLIMAAADAHKLPAGGALAVDREGFAAAVTRRLEAHPNISIVREEVAGLPPEEWANVIVATGPLTSEPLAAAIRALTGAEGLAFFDAIAPIVHFDSIDMDVCWFQSRYDKGGADYINCPLNREQYETFVRELLAADKVDFREWEKTTPYFDGCLPIEVMAARGPDTLRHGPMKPVGLTNPHRPDEKPYAVVQLRQDNALGTLYNMVGFQTKLTYGEQKRIFRLIPGLENARFARLGGLHRNTFLNSPELLDEQLRLKADPRLRFAGQMTGVEGYVESAACGLIAGRAAAFEVVRGRIAGSGPGNEPQRGEGAAGQRLMPGLDPGIQQASPRTHEAAVNVASSLPEGRDFTPPPATTAHGALIHHITGGHIAGGGTFQPMNINFGLFPPIEPPTHDENGKRLKGKERTKARRRALTARALADFERWLRG